MGIDIETQINILLSYIDKSSSKTIKEYIKYIPVAAFVDKEVRSCFSKVVNGQDIYKAIPEDGIRGKTLSDLFNGESYKTFEVFDDNVKIGIIKEFLEEYRNKKFLEFVEGLI
jgi:hypothetical protein